jgi:hypothetical protein
MSPRRRQVTADGERDQREPCEGHRGAGPVAAGGALAQGQGGEEDGEQRLGLHHDRGQAGRHP